VTKHPEIPYWTEPNAIARLDILRSTRTIAMVGVSPNPARPSNFVATYLLSSSTDYEVYFVNPSADEILGRPCVPTLDDLCVTPDLVDVFRRLEDVPGIAEQAVAIGSATFWTQFGLWSPDAAEMILGAEMNLVMDRCIKVEHARFAGGLHLSGFNTGIVDSRRNRRETAL